MDDDSRLGIKLSLFFDMIGSNSVMDVTRAHHEPQAIDGLILLLEELCRVEA
jgi:hypothetical protein